jgi:hypothetical protein
VANLEHDLFSLRKVVGRIPVKGKLAERGERNDFLRYNLSGIKKVKTEAELIFLFHYLHFELEERQSALHTSQVV